MAISRDGASQLLNVPPAKGFNELILQIYREKSLQQVISGAYDYSNVLDRYDASQDENRNPQVQNPGVQIQGIEGRSLSPHSGLGACWRLLHHHAISMTMTSVGTLVP